VTINNLMPGLFDTDRLRVGLGVQARAAGQPLETYFVQKREGSVAGRFGLFRDVPTLRDLCGEHYRERDADVPK